MSTRVVIKKSALRALIREMLDNKLPVQSNPVLKVARDSEKDDEDIIEPSRKEPKEIEQ